MTETQKTISPIDGSLYIERPYARQDEIGRSLERAVTAQRAWAQAPVANRSRVCEAFADELVSKIDDLARELAWQIGRPIAHAPSEILTCAARARSMVAEAAQGLAEIRPAAVDGYN